MNGKMPQSERCHRVPTVTVRGCTNINPSDAKHALSRIFLSTVYFNGTKNQRHIRAINSIIIIININNFSNSTESQK